MDTKDSSLKPQQTGGLKLMTVFIAVLALHVVVIGGITVYHLMSGGSTDADVAAADKNHKAAAVADSANTDASQPDKSVPAPTPPVEVATIPANPVPAPTPAPTPQPTPAPAPNPEPTVASTPAVVAPNPATPAPSAPVISQETPSGPLSPELAPPPDSTPPPMISGPVHMPAAGTPQPVSQQTYTVKITDSYKKIAHAHHITVAQLKEANHIKTDVLHSGQKLVIPSSRTSVAETSASTMDSTRTILSDSGSSSATTVMSGSSHHLYTVVKGDTLTKIAHKFRTTPTALMAENSIADPTKLVIGKKLKIPSRESRSARSGSPSSTQPAQVQAKETTASAQLANFVP